MLTVQVCTMDVMKQLMFLIFQPGEYRSRVLTGDLPEGFLQLDDNRNTTTHPPGSTHQQAMLRPNVPMHVVTRIKVTVTQVWK
jgi:hypothetical protein